MDKICVGDYVIGNEEKKAVNNVLDSGRISEGKCVKEFEKQFAEIIGRKYCTLVNSGTSALIAGLTALLYDDRYPNIKKGSKVIVSPVTYVATVNAIKLVEMEPVFVDINPITFDIIPYQIESALKLDKDISIILPVHLMGYACNMELINKIADKYNVVVFEDSAQAHGTKYKGKNTGSMSLLADFSFYIAHNIQVGEMGAVVTDDKKINSLVKKIKTNGRMCECSVCTRLDGNCKHKDDDYDHRFKHDMIGYNFKTMEFQASLGLVQLNKFNDIINRRKEIVKYLNDGLIGVNDLVTLPTRTDDTNFLGYPLILNKKCIRTYVCRELEKLNIETRPLFGCIPTQQPAYSEYKEKYKDILPNADYVGNNAFYVGCHQYLTDDQLDYMIDSIKSVLCKLR